MHENRILIHKLKNFENINSNFLIIALILFGSILLAISAKVQVPFWPVPMTMQTFVIFLIGMTYSVRLSFATVAFYLFQGALGLPVFAAGGGVAYLVGPTAGYLYGMLFASVVISSGIISSNAQECAGKSISGIISIFNFFAYKIKSLISSCE